MADTLTPTLSLTDLVEAQAGAAARMNKNMRIMEAMINLAIIDRDLSTPPGSPADGACYLVASGGTGDWSGQDGDIAIYSTTLGWMFQTPVEGVVGRVLDENIRIEYDGSAWQTILTGASAKQAVVRLDSPANGDQVPLLYTVKAITISSIISVVEGGTPSCTWNIMHNATRNAAGTQVFTSDPTTTSKTTGEVDTGGFNDETIPAGRYVWAEIESAPTDCDAIEWYVFYSEDED